MASDTLEGLLRAAARKPGMLSFAGGLPAPDTFPRRALAAAAGQAVGDLRRDPLQYQWPEGRGGLRAWVAARLAARGADVVAEDVVLTNGAQDALALALDVLAPKAIQVDVKSYPAALDLFRSRNCVVRSEPARVRYAMPALSNPGGRRMSSTERTRALQAAFVIEDDAYAELCFDGAVPRPLLAKARDRVFHIGTFSKTLSPGLRVGWLVPPRAWLPRVRDENGRRDLHGGGLAQAIVEKFLLRVDYDERLRQLRALYRRRCETMRRALTSLPHIRFSDPVGGFSVWVDTDLHMADDKLLRAALCEGVAFDPGSLFAALNEPRQALCLRLCFSCIPEHRIGAGVGRLERVLEQARASQKARWLRK